MLTRWLVFHVASGQSFFSGLACLVVAVGLSSWRGRGRVRVSRNLLIGLGAVLVAASATPLPVVAYLGLGVVSLVWLGAEATSGRLTVWLVGACRVGVVVAWLGAGLAEWPYQVVPRLPGLGQPVLGIVGDSITAGMGDRGEITWPQRVADRHPIVVRDHSVAGATLASATAAQVRAVQPEERLVLLEIGGNDLLGGASPAQFEAELDRLLTLVRRPGRTVAMFELPLWPGMSPYGEIQRRLAAKFGVFLIPKRILLGALLDAGATLDSIHLTAPGHDRLAAAVWEVVRSAYEGNTTR